MSAAGDPGDDDGRALAATLALATVVLHLATAGGYHMFRDEFYYVACGRHLDWGYVDHPPLIALIARFSAAIGAHSLALFRLAPALAGALTVWLAAAIARRLGGGRYAQGLAALGVMVAPAFLEGFTLLTVNAFEFLAWTLVLWLLVGLLAGDSPARWVWLGVVAGLGLETKHSTGFLLAGLAAGLLLVPERRLLRTRGPWLAAAIALLLLVPNLVWQAQHHWPTLEFLAHARATKNAPVTVGSFLLGQVLLIHPLTAPVWLAGLGWLLLAPAARPWRVIAWAYVVIFAVFVATGAKIYYLAGFYPALLGAGAVAVERATRVRIRPLRPVIATAWVVGGLVLAPVVLPVLPPAALERYMHALRLTPPATERHRPPRLTQSFADEFGWQEMVAQVARAYHALPAAEQAHCLIFASNYGEAGALDWYGPRYGLPPAASGHNSYWLWGPPPGRGASVITVGEDPDDVAKSYTEVTVVDSTRCEWCMPYENGRPIILGRGPRAPLGTIWPHTRKYI